MAVQGAPSRKGAKRGLAAGAIDYLAFYRAGPLERIGIVRRGVSAATAKRIIGDLDIPSGSATRALNVSVSTLNRKSKDDDALARDEGERVLGLARLIGQVKAMVEESGNSAGFDASRWIARWLGEPLPALGGARPLDLMDTMEGQGLVAETLARLQSGAYG